MAPIKFEEQLKDKLEKRTLAPSAEGWSKLSERLEADEKNSRNPIFWWLGIAAGIIIMIAVSVQYFNNEDGEAVIPQVVEEKIKESNTENGNENFETSESVELAIEDETLENEKETEPEIKEAQIIEYKKVTKKTNKPKTQLAEQKRSTIEASTQKEEPIIKQDASIDLKKAMIKDAVATALKDLKAEETSVTDREIDSLLKVSSKELFKNKLQKESSKTVDADALLLSVEEDMGQSFRSKVFDALKESFETVKTAVAERNN